MSSQDTRKRHSMDSPIGKIPKLPPIHQYQKSSARFDNSPLLKYRRSNDVQDLLGNIVYVLCLKSDMIFLYYKYSSMAILFSVTKQLAMIRII